MKNHFAEESDTVKITFRLQSAECINNFVNKLNVINWAFDEFSDINGRVAHFNKVVYEAYNDSFPIKVKHVSVKRFQKP